MESKSRAYRELLFLIFLGIRTQDKKVSIKKIPISDIQLRISPLGASSSSSSCGTQRQPKKKTTKNHKMHKNTATQHHLAL
jgi:hypothetical protein